MKILLSPAKSIDTSKKLEGIFCTQPQFLEDSEYLVNKLQKFSARKIKSVMKVSDAIAELNVERYKNWHIPKEQTEEVVPAIRAFTGEVYRGLNADSFSKKELDFAQDSIRILSGLYGILRPLDLMYPYRLEMGTRWAVTKKNNNLYKYWGIKLTESLNAELNEEDAVINLASKEYFKAIQQKELKAKWITPIFKDFKNGEYKVIMTFAKNARGAMANFIVKNGLTQEEEIKSFKENDYAFSEEHSTATDWVFVRKK